MAKIIDIDDHGQTLEDIKFKLKINKDQAEEIMSYNQLMDYIQKGIDAEEDPDSLFKFRDIVANQGPLESTDPKGLSIRGFEFQLFMSFEVSNFPLKFHPKLRFHFDQIEVYFNQSYDGISMFQNTRKSCRTSSHCTLSFISNQSSPFHHHHHTSSQYKEPCHQQPTSCYTKILCKQNLLVMPA